MRLWVFKRHFSTIFQLYIDLWATFPGANMVQGRNTLGYFTYPDILHTGKKVRLQIHIDHKMFDMFTSRNVKKNLWISTLTSDQILGMHPRCPTKYSELEGVDSQICRTFLWSESDILGGICPTWKYEHWYTWSFWNFS